MDSPGQGQSGKRRRREAFRCGPALAWGLAWMLGAQAAVLGYLEGRHPELLDPKYGCRMLALRDRQRANSERPLWLVLGTSRTEQGFRPGELERVSGPLFYNLGRGGSSPLMYLLTLRRLLADGIRPTGLLVEIFPPALAADEEGVTIHKPTLRDLPLLRRYPVSAQTWALAAEDRLLLWYKYRNALLAQVAPQALSPRARWGDRLWDYRGGEWRIIGAGVEASERRRLTDDAHRRYAAALHDFSVAEVANRALRELLQTCRRQRIDVVLFLMPEASEFRGWYPPATRCRLSSYLDALQREHGVPLIDAGDWIDDAEFSDGHHLLARGATAFTQRFAAEVRHVLGHEPSSFPPGRTP